MISIDIPNPICEIVIARKNIHTQILFCQYDTSVAGDLNVCKSNLRKKNAKYIYVAQPLFFGKNFPDIVLRILGLTSIIIVYLVIVSS